MSYIFSFWKAIYYICFSFISSFLGEGGDVGCWEIEIHYEATVLGKLKSHCEATVLGN